MKQEKREVPKAEKVKVKAEPLPIRRAREAGRAARKRNIELGMLKP